jgi:hypothetical protein
LPLPGDLAEFLALPDEVRPDSFHHAVATPALEPTMDRRIIPELLGQPIPLAAASETMNDPVEEIPPVRRRLPAFGTGLPILLENGLDPSPEFVADFPDGIQRLGLQTLL